MNWTSVLQTLEFIPVSDLNVIYLSVRFVDKSSQPSPHRVPNSTKTCTATLVRAKLTALTENEDFSFFTKLQGFLRKTYELDFQFAGFVTESSSWKNVFSCTVFSILK